MGRGLKDINKNLKNVDIIIEVHDARIPLTGRNQLLHKSVENIRPVILVLNKRDLIDSKYEKLIQEKLKDQTHIKKLIFTNCKDQFCKGKKVKIRRGYKTHFGKKNMLDYFPFSVFLFSLDSASW